MRVLDIDLDFFLADVCPLAEKGCRPCLEGHEPWPEEDARRFMEENLGLSKDKPLPGRIFETHDGALKLWDELIRAGRLTAPFEVTHIDAHSDLGIGYPGPGMVLNGALSQNLAVRRNLEHYYKLKQLDEANYLLYALSFRWVSALENIRNVKSRPDMPREIVCKRDENGVPTSLKLISPLRELFEKINGAEPEIPYREFQSPAAYKTDLPFDYMSLAISPRYAPKEADALASVIGEYMTPI